MADDGMTMGYLMGQSEGNNNGGGMWGNDGIWAFLLFALIFGGGRGFGFGGGGGFGGGNDGIASGFAWQNIDGGIRAIQNGIADSTYALNNSIISGFYGVDKGLCNLGAQLAQCCCDNRAAVADLKYTVASEFCGLGNTIQNTTRDIIDNQNSGTRAILDFLTQDKIATLTAENQSLKFAASQANQNAFITANQEAQTAELIRRLGRDCPVPAYVVPNPNCCYGNPLGVGYNYGGNYGGGCGCGCG